MTTWQRKLTGTNKRTTTNKAGQQLIGSGRAFQEYVREGGEKHPLPLLAYYGTGRLWQQKKNTANKFNSTSRTIGYTDCLDPASSYKSFVDWFRYWSMNAFNAKMEASKAGKTSCNVTEFDEYIESVSDAVNTCLAPTEWGNISYSFSIEQLVVYHPQHGELPVANLSDGIRNTIGMVADIAFRATKLNPQLGAKAALETPGIVLIDEVDMHLHPQWQQTILESLTKAFPKIQFIVTTHSPQVLSCVDKSSIRVLREKIDYETQQKTIVVEEVQQQTRGVSSADLLAEIMGVNPVPNIPESRMVSEYHALIAQNLHETEEGKDIRLALEKHFGNNHPVMYECDRMIRLQAFKNKLSKKD